MALAEALWRASIDIARACRDHPFVRGLADGSLPAPVFAGYVAQDAFFLDAFARAYAIAAAKAPDPASLRAFLTLAAGVVDELRLHEGYATSLGITLTGIQPLGATRRYTDFLLATAWTAPPGRTAAAMTPCMRLYAYLGTDLARDGVPAHPYGDWIRTYGSPEFAALVTELERLVNTLASDDRDTTMTYRYAMDCELAFFQSAWEAAP